MNKADILVKLALIPYLYSLYILNADASLIVSIVYTALILNIDLALRSRLRIIIKPSWIIPLSLLIYYIIILFIPGYMSISVAFLSILILLLSLYKGDLKTTSNYLWLYIIILASVFIIIPVIGFRYYIFYLATPALDYMWFRVLSNVDYLDYIISISILALLYYLVNPLLSIYVIIVNLIRILIYNRDLDTYLMFIDYYTRIGYGWLIGFGY